MKRTKKKHLTKDDILFLMSDILFDVLYLVHEDCKNPVQMGNDIAYVMNVIADQFSDYFFTIEELREIDKKNEQKKDF